MNIPASLQGIPVDRVVELEVEWDLSTSTGC